MHRFLVVGVAALAALALSAPAGAWTWPADGAVLRPFGLGSDPYAGGQHRGVDVAGPEGAADPRTRRGNRHVRRVAPDARPRRDDPDGGRLRRHARPPRRDRRREGRVRRGRRADRDDGVERDARACRAERPPRDPARERLRRVRRPARAASAPGGSGACAEPGADSRRRRRLPSRRRPLRRLRPLRRRTRRRTRPATVGGSCADAPRRRPLPPPRGSPPAALRCPHRRASRAPGALPATSPDPVRGSSSASPARRASARAAGARRSPVGAPPARPSWRTTPGAGQPTPRRAASAPPSPAVTARRQPGATSFPAARRAWQRPTRATSAPPPAVRRPPPNDSPAPTGSGRRDGVTRGASGASAADRRAQARLPSASQRGDRGRADPDPRSGARDPRRRRRPFGPLARGVPPRVPRRGGRDPQERP